MSVETKLDSELRALRFPRVAAVLCGGFVLGFVAFLVLQGRPAADELPEVALVLLLAGTPVWLAWTCLRRPVVRPLLLALSQGLTGGFGLWMVTALPLAREVWTIKLLVSSLLVLALLNCLGAVLLLLGTPRRLRQLHAALDAADSVPELWDPGGASYLRWALAGGLALGFFEGILLWAER